MNQKRIDCFNCQYLQITWDKKFPRGCKAYGFKSKYPPSLVVFYSSGMRCQLFNLKKTR